VKDPGAWMVRRRLRPTCTRRLFEVCATLALAALVGTAVAADADALVKEGVALRRAGDDAAAVKKFEQAHAIEQSPRTSAQLGLAEQALGRWGAADRHLRAALSTPSDAWITKNRRLIEQALQTVEQRVGKLEIVGSPAGSEVRIDGELVGKLPFERAVAATAGSVAIEVRAPGYLTMVRSSQIVTGGVTRESFNLQSMTPAGAEPLATNSSSGRVPVAAVPAAVARPSASSPLASANDPAVTANERQMNEGQPAAEADGDTPGLPAGRVVAIVAGGLAIGALAFGLFEHVKWQDRVSTFDRNSACNLTTPGYGSMSCSSLYDEGQRARTLTFVGYGAAGVLAAAAVAFYLITPSPAPAAPSVACAPEPGILAAGNLGLACAGRF